MSCPDCGSLEFTFSEEKFQVVTYNPTIPLVDNVIKYTCSNCFNVWFQVSK